MKRSSYILIAITAILSAGCSFLDISPDLGLSDKDVFTKYSNFKAYLESIYTGTAKKDSEGATPLNIIYSSYPLRMDANTYRFTFDDMTELADAGRQGLRCEAIKSGTLGENCAIFVDFRIPIFEGNYHCIRIANKCIENIDRIKDSPEKEKYDMLGQAYFLRAWCHLTIASYYGGIPYLDHSLKEDESWDIAQGTAVETFQKCANDFKTAYEYFEKAGCVRRDPFPGKAGHLSDARQNKPNGVAAMALRGRALLYAASPLANTTNDPQLWKDAADANSEALNLAKEYQYDLVPWAEWENNTAFVAYTNEQLWAHNFGSLAANSDYLCNFLSYPIHNNTAAGGTNPTQEAVDLYETVWGDPLYTQEDRDAAYGITGEGVRGPDGKMHHYYEQDPYKNRDPRFYKNIIFDGSTAAGVSGEIKIYYSKNTQTWPTTNLSGKQRAFGCSWNKRNYAETTTGYYCRKRWDGKYTGSKIQVTDPLIRLAEVYLNYSEAANMAYGPGGASQGQISALEAVNTVRARANMPAVQDRFTGSAEELNKRIQNERTVEFMFEGHHYFIDSRRWKTAPERMGALNHGMYIESCEKTSEFPQGKTYTRKEIVHQTAWKDAMYYFYLYREEANKYMNYKNNEIW